MHSNEHEVLKQALRWRGAGHRTVLVTVLSTFGASPRPPGSLAVISERRLISGSVSGGCVEDDLVQEVASGAFWPEGAGHNICDSDSDRPGDGEALGDLAAHRVALRTYGRDAAERERYRLPCGNALRLAIEPYWSGEVATQALAAMGERRLLVRRLDYATGEATLKPFAGEPDFNDDDKGLCHVLGPRHRLLLIGATEVSRYLLPIAQSLGYAVTVCDPRVEYTDAWPSDEDTRLTRDMPDDAVLAFGCDERTAVVTVTHDPKLDDLALMEALKSDAFYVGALGSPITTARRKDRLRLFDLSEAQVDALHGPVGLPIGSRSPAEIAVSIAAELVQIRRLMESGGDALQGREVKPAWMPSSAAYEEAASALASSSCSLPAAGLKPSGTSEPSACPVPGGQRGSGFA